MGWDEHAPKRQTSKNNEKEMINHSDPQNLTKLALLKYFFSAEATTNFKYLNIALLSKWPGRFPYYLWFLLGSILILNIFR